MEDPEQGKDRAESFFRSKWEGFKEGRRQRKEEAESEKAFWERQAEEEYRRYQAETGMEGVALPPKLKKKMAERARRVGMSRAKVAYEAAEMGMPTQEAPKFETKYNWKTGQYETVQTSPGRRLSPAEVELDIESQKTAMTMLKARRAGIEREAKGKPKTVTVFEALGAVLGRTGEIAESGARVGGLMGAPISIRPEFMGGLQRGTPGQPPPGMSLGHLRKATLPSKLARPPSPQLSLGLSTPVPKIPLFPTKSPSLPGKDKKYRKQVLKVRRSLRVR